MMTTIENRVHDRYVIGGRVDFNVGDSFYSGLILNTGLGGVLIALDSDSNYIDIGEISNLSIFDMFSNEKYTFIAEIVRKNKNSIVCKFIAPLTDVQMLLLENWFSISRNPSYCV